MTPKSAKQWEKLKKLALSLGLPGVVEATSWGQPCLKAHGKLWLWWSPSEDAPVFKVPFEERDMLVEADPDSYFFTPHYRNYPMVLVRPDRLDPEWARTKLLIAWRDMAPKRLLKAYDAEQEAKKRKKK
ncbi:MAG: MmcQ/YjbR family DNA-binding protein [Pseudomonadota bacterium]|nr:MmcQ/YjbR family DNA-binding protein [Pseudomonadota bacterium]